MAGRKKRRKEPDDVGISALQTGDWPSPNFTPANRQVGDVLGIVVHDTESTSASALAWLTNPASEVSAHYVISEAGGIYRLVQERHIAWHTGAFGSDPSKNRNQPDWLPPWAGQPYSSTNQYTIGIELAGFAARGYAPIQYQALGLVCAQVCRAWGLLPTLLPQQGAAARLVTHGWLQTDRTDPGALFDWELFGSWLTHYYGHVPPPEPVPPPPPTPEDITTMTDDELIDTVLATYYEWAGLGHAFNRDSGICKCWVAALRAGVYAGRPRTADRAFDSSLGGGYWAEFDYRTLIWKHDGTMSWTG